MSKTFKIEVVASNAPAISQEANLVELPGEIGEFGVMAGHMSLLSALKPGVMRIINGHERELYFLAGGFAEVNATSVIVLAEEYVKAEEIDVDEAKRIKKESEEVLSQKKEGADLKSAQHALSRANARLKTAEELKSLKK